MPAVDPISCLLCLDAFERPAMLRIHLRPIGGGDPREYFLCQRCGGAIAAEYLFIQNSGKEPAAVAEVSGLSPDPGAANGLSAEAPVQQVMQPPLEEAAAGVVETQTVEAPKDSHKGRKKG